LLGFGDGVLLGFGDGVGDGPVAVAVGDALGDGVPVAVGDGLGEGVGLTVVDGEGDGAVVGVAVAEGAMLGVAATADTAAPAQGEHTKAAAHQAVIAPTTARASRPTDIRPPRLDYQTHDVI